MKYAIRYYSRTGHTKKVAEAMAEIIGVEAKPISEKIEEDVDTLFLGSAFYAASLDENIKKFIEDLDVNVGEIVNFSTATLLGSTYSQISKIAKEKNITMNPKEFHCKGAFGAIFKNRPNENDLEKAKIFAKEIINGED